MRTWRLEHDPDVHTARLVRGEIRTWLRDTDCSDDTTLDVVLVASELIGQAVANTATRVRVELIFDDSRLRLDVFASYAGGRTIPEDPDVTRLVEQIVEGATDAHGRTDTDALTHTWAEILS